MTPSPEQTALADAVAYIDQSPDRRAEPVEWAFSDAAIKMCKRCPKGMDVDKVASRILLDWSRKAHAALKGAEVLAGDFANARVDGADRESGRRLTNKEMSDLHAAILSKNSQFLAIRDCLREWPES